MKTLKTFSLGLTALSAFAWALPAQAYDSPGRDYHYPESPRSHNYDSGGYYYRESRPYYYRVYRPRYYRVYRPYYYDQGYYDCGPRYSYYRPYCDYYRPSISFSFGGLIFGGHGFHHH